MLLLSFISSLLSKHVAKTKLCYLLLGASIPGFTALSVPAVSFSNPCVYILGAKLIRQMLLAFEQFSYIISILAFWHKINHSFYKIKLSGSSIG
jgi:hypothetical protein